MTFEPLQQLEVSYTMRQLCFVNYKTLAILDHRESLKFLDVRLDEEVESMDCSDLDIIYEGSRYRAEDTGGNVSRAMVSCFLVNGVHIACMRNMLKHRHCHFGGENTRFLLRLMLVYG